MTLVGGIAVISFLMIYMCEIYFRNVILIKMLNLS